MLQKDGHSSMEGHLSEGNKNQFCSHELSRSSGMRLLKQKKSSLIVESESLKREELHLSDADDDDVLYVLLIIQVCFYILLMFEINA